MQNTCRRFCIKYWMNLLFWTSFCANYYPKGQRPSWGQSLLSVSLSAGLLTVKFKGNYEEMAPRMSLKWKRTLPTDVVETDVRRKPLADRAGGRAWVRQTETESDSRVWLARSVMENLTEHGAPIWFGGTQHHLGYDCVRPTGYIAFDFKQWSTSKRGFVGCFSCSHAKNTVAGEDKEMPVLFSWTDFCCSMLLLGLFPPRATTLDIPVTYVSYGKVAFLLKDFNPSHTECI